MRRAWWMIGVASILVVSGVPGPPPARAQGYPDYGGFYVPTPGNVYRGPGYYTYYYYPAPGYYYPAPGYYYSVPGFFYPPGTRFPVLRYSYGPPVEYAPVPRYSYPAPWYSGGYSQTRRYTRPSRPGGTLRFRGQDSTPYPY
jgi:hypothetical protein